MTIAISCDFCSAQFGGGYTWSQDHKIRRDARAAGWTGSMTRDCDNDMCPACTEKLQGTKMPEFDPKGPKPVKPEDVHALCAKERVTLISARRRVQNDNLRAWMATAHHPADFRTVLLYLLDEELIRYR